MYDLYDFKKRNAYRTMNKMSDPSTGTIPMNLADEKRDNKRKRLAFNAFIVLFSTALFFILIGALANLAIGFFDAGSIINSIAPSAGAASAAQGSLITFDPAFVINFDMVLQRGIDGALLGAVAGVIVGLILIGFHAIAEAASYKRFSSVRASLNMVRFVVCESSASVKDVPAGIFYNDGGCKKGNLFLTRSSLEFYDNDYLTPHRNFLVKLGDITVVESRGFSKIRIYTSKGKYVFKVPVGKAKFWRKGLLHAIQNGQRANFGR